MDLINKTEYDTHWLLEEMGQENQEKEMWNAERGAAEYNIFHNFPYNLLVKWKQC